MRKIVKIMVVSFVIIIIVLSTLIYISLKNNKSDKIGVDKDIQINNEIKTEVEHEPQEHRFEGYLISDLNKDDFEITDFNEKEKQIYQSAAVWKRKKDGKLLFRSVAYEELSNKYTEPLDIIGISSDKYEERMYLENKVWVDKVGVDAVYMAKFETEKMVFELCKKDCDFDKYMVTENFKSKYNEKDGILGDVEYDSIEYSKEYKDGGAYDLEYTNIIITKGKLKKEFKIDYIPVDDFSKALNDINIFSKRELTNENGESVKLKMDKDNWLNCIERLAFSDDEEVGKSEKFIEEHPNFTGIFPNICDVIPAASSIYSISFDESNSSFNKKTIVCNVHNRNLAITKMYKISYATNTEQYISEYKIEDLNMDIVDEYRGSKYANDKDCVINSEIVKRLITTGHDWSKLPLTNAFIKKFKNIIRLDEYEILSFNIPFVDKKLDSNKKVPLYIIDTNKQKHFYGLTFKIVDNLIDDVTITPLDITEFPKGDAAFDMF